MAVIDTSASSSMGVSSTAFGSNLTSASSSSSMVASSTASAGLVFTVAIADSLYASGQGASGRQIDVSTSDALSVSAAPGVNQVLTAAIQDGLRISAGLQFQGESYEGWVVNANTFAASRYSNFNFNSFALFQGQYYGAADDGIHILEGSDDDGDPIDAFVATANIKPFGHMQSRIHDAYFLMRDEGDMAVTVVVDGTPWTYTVEGFAETTQEQRVKLGKGLKTNVWRFELKNTEGGDFDIESFKIYPIELTRRR